MTTTWPEWYPPLVDLQGLPKDVAWAEADRLEEGDVRPWVLLLARLDFMED